MLKSSHRRAAALLPAWMVLCLLSMSGTSFAENLLGNGDFTGNTNWWIPWPNNEKVLRAEPHEGRDGNVGVLQPEATKTSAVIYQYASLKGLHVYAIDFWYKPVAQQAETSAQLHVDVYLNVKDGENGSAGYVTTAISLKSTDDQWRRHQQIFVAPLNAASAQFALRLENAPQGVWLDEIQMTDQTEVAIRRASAPPKVDGLLDDAIWQESAPLRGFFAADTATQLDPNLTAAWMTYDDQNIYVAFRNDEPYMNQLREKVTQRDGAVWSDDCIEIFILPPDAHGIHLAVNSTNTQADWGMIRDAAGDVQEKQEWNGTWQSAVAKSEKQWTVEVAIPLATLNSQTEPGTNWKIDLCRERYTELEQFSHWNRGGGGFGNVSQFADLKFDSTGAQLTRFVEDLSNDPLAIDRPDAQFESLLSDEPGNYLVGVWTANAYVQVHPASVQQQYTDETWRPRAEEILDPWGQAGMTGPGFPYSHWRLGWEMLERLNQKYGMTYPLLINNSSLSTAARDNGAKWYFPADEPLHRDVKVIEPALIKAIQDAASEYVKSDPRILDMMSFVEGIDEPDNGIFEIFSATRRPEMKAEMETLSQTIQEKFGYGKYGLFDEYAPEDETTAFKRIAFLKWWNHSLADALGQLHAFFKDLTPGKPFMNVGVNTTASMNPTDITVLAPHGEWISTDPYPTNTLALFGRGRALYHTGFSTKLMKDLGQDKALRVIGQCFIYGGRAPTPADIREFASQALKNGATVLSWFADGPAQLTIPDAYAEAIRVSGVVHKMNKLALPPETRTAIFFSQVDRWGRSDEPMNAAYSLYALLGERVGSWFEFVSDTQLSENAAALDSYQLIYLPALTYVDRPVAQRLIDRANAGATLVMFDPRALSWASDGTPLTDLRTEAGGFVLGAARQDNQVLSVDGAESLPLSPQKHGKNMGHVDAFTLDPLPSGAKIIATYSDGAPAAYRVTLGKGSVIWFAAQPFGDADMILNDNNWTKWFAALAAQAGEKTDLPIWNFLIPEQK